LTGDETPLYSPRLLGVGVWLLASGAALCVFMLVGIVGPFRFGSRTEGSSRAIALWEAPSADPAATRRRVSAWRRVVPDERALHVGASLDALLEETASVIAVPDARCISEAEVGALLEYARAGGGLLFAGAIAVETPSGEWRGFESMERVLGVAPVAPLAREDARALEPARSGPLSAALLPGERIQLVPEAGAPALAERESELAWARAGGEAGGATPHAASLRRELGRGRLVWLAAGPESAAGGLDAHTPIARLVRTAFAAAAGDPIVEVVPRTLAANGSDDARAWKQTRDAIAARADWAGPNRVLVDLTNRSDAAASALLRVYGIPPARRVALVATELFQQLPPLRDARASQHLDIPILELAGGVSESFYIDFEAAIEGPQ
jgi:hypothetical protein